MYKPLPRSARCFRTLLIAAAALILPLDSTLASGIDQYTRLLLHADGTNASATIPAVSGHTQTAYGSAALSTTQAKFGNASIKFSSGTSDYVLISNRNSDFDFGAGDFTIDMWVYQTSTATPVVLFAREQNTTYPPILLGYGGSQIYMSSTGNSWDVASGKSIGSVALNTWSHIELCRQGTTFYAFRNGNQTDSWTSSAAFPAKTGSPSIGSGQGGNYFNGYIDEVRVSKGICRHNSNFTPPSAPYSISAPPPYGTVVAESTVVNPSDYIDLADPYGSIPSRHYQLEFYHVVSDIETPPSPQSGAVLTAYISTDGGQSYDTGPYYNNTGISNFPGEANSTYYPPYAFGTPQALTLGMRLSVDTGDTTDYGATGIAHIMNAAGNTQYFAQSVKGAIGGSANALRATGTLPASLVGHAWFPLDGTAPFHWAIPVSYAGHYDGAPGSYPNAFRLKMDGGQNTTAKIESGTFVLRRMD